MNSLPKLSVCIPAYNRAQCLPALLDSAISQNYANLEIVICEDLSPEREAIANIVSEYQDKTNADIRYFENQHTLGFDGNLRNLFERATGDYCVMMGNDDLLCSGSLHTIGRLLSEHPEVGVVIRSYGWFSGNPDNLDDVVSYFPETSLFPPGDQTVITFFRRVGVLAGLVFRREDANAVATDRFDGTLYYQMHVAGKLLLNSSGLYIARPIALCRVNAPDFGISKAERNKFKPGEYTAAARINMIQSMLRIAKDLELSTGRKLYAPILKDIGNYSYYFLSFQSDAPLIAFWRYYREMGKLGFNNNILFHAYFAILAIGGKRRCELFVRALRSTLKSTPRLGSIRSGTPVHIGSDDGSE